MVFHLIPRIYNRYSDVEACLVDVRIPAANLVLSNGKQITVRRPYPNKSIHVASIKKGRKAIEGLLVELPDGLTDWHVDIRWAVDATDILTHRINYKLVDSDHDAVTDSVLMWSRYNSKSFGFWDARPTPEVVNAIPIHLQPSMEILFEDQVSTREASFKDRYDERGTMIYREEEFTVPSVELGRITGESPLTQRFPKLADMIVSND